ncbi:hypothetical protein [Methylocaldum sp.]|uniref:hypothetical protein n=1 Tax=Methylocaldum sp. TaxID=1969727 RepID=UPI002D283A78|nr:hypothetical protein [Methylocaldum sp.]HYE35774.1 hypothetical protein [Methylocaldum sp.]
MPYTVQRDLAGYSIKLLYVGLSVIITTFALILALVLFVFLPQDGFGTSARAKERLAFEMIVNATGIDNPAKATLPENRDRK